MIKVFEAFAGYGSQSIALERIHKKNPNFKYEIVGISEIDENEIKAYNQLHDKVKNYGDICKIDWYKVPDFNCFTYSFPCNDISLLGKQKGFREGSDTRSSLLWQCKKIIELKKPKYLLMENVKALTFKQNEPDFKVWRDFLERLGYSNYYKVLDSLDYGIPQHRERVFMISILGKHNPYEFPTPIKECASLTDIIENDVSDSFYYKPNDKGLYTSKRFNRFIETVTLPKEIAWIDIWKNRIKTQYTQTITTRTFGAGNHYFFHNNRFRKPTPRELFRLMGLKDKEIDKLLELKLSNTTYGFLAGNSIVIPVLEAIFTNLFLKLEIHR